MRKPASQYTISEGVVTIKADHVFTAHMQTLYIFSNYLKYLPSHIGRCPCQMPSPWHTIVLFPINLCPVKQLKVMMTGMFDVRSSTNPLTGGCNTGHGSATAK